MNRRAERLLVSTVAGMLLGLVAVGGSDWILDGFDVYLATTFGVVGLVYAIELAIANGLESKRRR